MKKAVSSKYREYVRETLAEYQRRGNYVRIYPAKGSDIYDSYFMGPRPYNKAVYKLFLEMKCLNLIKYTSKKLLQNLPKILLTQKSLIKLNQLTSNTESSK